MPVSPIHPSFIAMADSLEKTSSASGQGRLKWKSQWGYQVATDSRCLYIRESGGSILAAFIFSVAISAAAGCLGMSVFLSETPTTAGEKAFAVLMLGVTAVFATILIFSLRRGRWMLVYDRGGPGAPAEIRYRQNQRLAAERVRAFSTRACGGRTPQSTVVAELHDGTQVGLGPVSSAAWTAHYAQQAAIWMGLPFRPGT